MLYFMTMIAPGEGGNRTERDIRQRGFNVIITCNNFIFKKSEANTTKC